MGDTVEASWNNNLSKVFDEALAQGINNASVHLQGKMKDNFGRDGTGDVFNNVVGAQSFKYKKDKDGNFVKNSKGKRKKVKSQRAIYKAAAPGNFPAVRTGRLRQSIGLLKASPSNLQSVCGTNLAYGRWLEYGAIRKAPDGSPNFLPARPWCLRSLNEEKSIMLSICANTVNEALKNVKADGGGGSK